MRSPLPTFAIVLLLAAPLHAQPADREAPPASAPETPETPTVAPQPDTVGLMQVMDVARAKAEQGLKYYAASEWRAALEHFAVANQLFPAPTLVMYMGHCQRELGALLEARRLYRQVAAQSVPDAAPQAYREAVTTSASALEALETRIPKVRVSIIGMAPADAEATVDGAAIALSPTWVDVDPGEHVVVARGKRADPVSQTVVAAEGQTLEVTLALRPIASTTIVRPVVTRGPPVGLWPPLVFAGIGVAGFGVGAVTGGLVLAKVADLETRCGGFSCPSSLRGERDDVKPLATASTIAFVIGGVGVAAAAVLFPLHFFGGDDPPEVSIAPGALFFPPCGALSLRGRF